MSREDVRREMELICYGKSPEDTRGGTKRKIEELLEESEMSA